MESSIRRAAVEDGPLWLDLLNRTLGPDYPDRQIYAADWIGSQFDSALGHETWLAQAGERLMGSVTFLQPLSQSTNPVLNVGRQLFLDESFTNGTAESLLAKVNALADERGQMVVARILAKDLDQQKLHEKLGYVCAGFQPFKHLFDVRHGVVFYVRLPSSDAIRRRALPETLPQTLELGAAVLEGLGLHPPARASEGVTGYPLQVDLQIDAVPYNDFALWRLQSHTQGPPTEISSGYNLGLGLFRVSGENQIRALLARRAGTVVAGLAYLEDPRDRCIRLVDSFGIDDLSMGVLFQQVSRQAQEQFNAGYVEADILTSAPRLLKTAEQLGYVPVAYLPAFFSGSDGNIDVVKVVKLNLAYALEPLEFAPGAKRIVGLIDQSFQDQKIGASIINLLKGLPVLAGLGEGEIRKAARLFVQKLFRPGERVFSKGEPGDEVFVIMRGQIDIHADDRSPAVATLGNGQIFGELAFLDGAPRAANAVATQASILLVVSRVAFNDLVQREPQLGLRVVRNIALELAGRLRRSNLLHATVSR